MWGLSMLSFLNRVDWVAATLWGLNALMVLLILAILGAIAGTRS